MIQHLSPSTGLEPGTLSFTRVNRYSSLPQEAFPKPLQFACAHNSQKTKHTLQRSLRPLMGDQKVKHLVEIFMLYVLVVKISDFFGFFLKFMCHFKSSTCCISMADFQA
jgi:hypothetical protein